MRNNFSSSAQIIPERVVIDTYNDDNFPKQQTDCTFYFNLAKDVSRIYELSISEDILGCKIEPVKYSFEETMMYMPAFMP